MSRKITQTDEVTVCLHSDSLADANCVKFVHY